MKLLVESGATKSTWLVLDGGIAIDRQVLNGVNPTSNPKSISVIKSYTSVYKKTIKSIDYYGAGVSTSRASTLLREALSEHFMVDKIRIEPDSLAACRSVSDGIPSIVAILGTGMNVVLYDGAQIIHSSKSLGYLFGDDGSGFYIGKLILQAYYAQKMSNTDSEAFKSQYISGQEDLIFKIYNSLRPNYETAQLTKFLAVCSSEFRKAILYRAFNHFFKNQVVTIDNHKAYPINFVGSVAKIFEIELREVALEYDFNIHKVIADPIDGLVRFYSK